MRRSGKGKDLVQMNCRVCGYGYLDLVLDLGYHPPSDAFLSDLNQTETYYPLRMVQCPKCGLAQLDHTVPKEVLFNNDYPYETGTNVDGIKHFAELAKTVLDAYQLQSVDLVVDIGSNDGTLLSHFKTMGCRVLGVEPVKHIAKHAKVRTLDGFWDVNLARKIVESYGKAKVITATNVFAHVDDLHEFMGAVDVLLDKNGVFVVEAPSLRCLVDELAYDTIYHEHLSYLDQFPVSVLVSQYNMNVVATEHRQVHGGTTRYYILRGEYREPRGEPVDFTGFAHRVMLHRLNLKRIVPPDCVGVSAPAKGNTLLNVVPIDLRYVTDNSPRKINRFTPGRHFPVYGDHRLLEDQPGFALILAWNWKEQIKRNLSDYKGVWIVPFPEPHFE